MRFANFFVTALTIVGSEQVSKEEKGNFLWFHSPGSVNPAVCVCKLYSAS